MPQLVMCFHMQGLCSPSSPSSEVSVIVFFIDEAAGPERLTPPNHRVNKLRAREEGHARVEGSIARTKPLLTPGVGVGPGLGVKAGARPVGMEVGARNDAKFLPVGCRVCALFCLCLPWLGLRQRLQIWREERPVCGNPEGPGEQWGGPFPGCWWRVYD